MSLALYLNISSRIGHGSDEKSEYEMKPWHWKGWSLSPKHLGIWLGVVAALGLGLSHISGLPYWGASVIIAGALIVTGLVAEVEDRSPGGLLSAGETKSTSSAEPPSDA